MQARFSWSLSNWSDQFTRVCGILLTVNPCCVCAGENPTWPNGSIHLVLGIDAPVQAVDPAAEEQAEEGPEEGPPEETPPGQEETPAGEEGGEEEGEEESGKWRWPLIYILT